MFQRLPKIAKVISSGLMNHVPLQYHWRGEGKLVAFWTGQYLAITMWGINQYDSWQWLDPKHLSQQSQWMFQALLQKMNQYTHDTLPETSSSPLKIDGWKMILSFWEGPSFQVLCLFVFGRLSHNHLYFSHLSVVQPPTSRKGLTCCLSWAVTWEAEAGRYTVVPVHMAG